MAKEEWSLSCSTKRPKTVGKSGFDELRYTCINEITPCNIKILPREFSLHEDKLPVGVYIQVGEVRRFKIDSEEVNFTVSGLSNGIYTFEEYFES